MGKFFILGLPRTRTYWFSIYFDCLHEAIYYYPEYQVFLDSSEKADCNTYYPVIKELIKDYPKVFIDRPLREVVRSHIKLFGFAPKELEEWESIILEGEGLHIPYHEINENLDIICNYVGQPFVKEKNKMIHQILENEMLIQEVKKCL